jgi:predicted 2-oxoglutarate/Fe(II)-dependent dioxygenase YbiX
MSKRLQVLVEERDLKEIQRIARSHRTTVAEWVRQALRDARQQEALGDAGRKIEAVRAAALRSFPTGDIDQMIEEIERGYVPAERP